MPNIIYVEIILSNIISKMKILNDIFFSRTVSLAVCLGYFGGKDKLFSCFIKLICSPSCDLDLWDFFFLNSLDQVMCSGYKKLAMFKGHHFHMCLDIPRNWK